LTPVAKGTPEGPAEAQAVMAAFDVVQLDLQVVANDLATGVTGSTLNQDIAKFDAAFVQFINAEIDFIQDSFHDATSSASKSGSASHSSLPGADVRELDALFADFDGALRDFI
jgi:hypothetical protein